ncbi:hypothetical protein MMC27_007624 [Xylographa pallens]|nr:hypothetical protein [Xylographa pallens]
MHLLTFLNASLFMILFIAVRCYDINTGMTPLYVVPNANSALPQLRLGSCSADNLAKLQSSFKEAITVVQNAIAAIDNLKSKAPNKITSRNKHKTWIRQAELLKAMFNINTDLKNGLGNGNTDANTVRTSFSKMITAASYSGFTSNQATYYAFCNDDWVKWINPSDTDPIDSENPKRQLSQSRPAYSKGGWCFWGGTASYQIKDYRVLKNARDGSAHAICQQNTYAGTLYSLGFITFCDKTFREPETKASLSITKNAIKAGDLLDAQVTMAQVWIHEWGHLVNNFLDMNAVDRLGNTISVTDPATGATVPQPTYGWTACSNLAHWRPADALITADTYAVFAMGTYFDNWGWAAGAATK